MRLRRVCNLIASMASCISLMTPAGGWAQRAPVRLPAPQSSQANDANDNPFLAPAQQDPVQPARPANPEADLAGLWVDTSGEDPRQPLADEVPGVPADPTRTAMYLLPRYVKVASLGPGQIYVEPVNFMGEPNGPTPAGRRSMKIGQSGYLFYLQPDGSYATGTSTVSFPPSSQLGGHYMTVNMALAQGTFLNGRYRPTTLPDRRTLSRDRFDPELLEERDVATSAFSSQMNEGRFRPNLYGYDPLEMSPEVAERGRRQAVFDLDPNQKSYSFDGNFGKSFPYGLRGFLNKRARLGTARIALSSEAAIQRGTSDSMGLNIMGVGVNFARDKATEVRTNSTLARELILSRAFRYTILVDWPNVRLDPGFKDDLIALSEGRTDANRIVATYGTHFAQSIAYGGNSICEDTTTGEEQVASLSRKYSTELAANVPGKGGGSFSDSSSSSDSKGSSTTISNRNCTADGGRGVDMSWSLDDEDSIPLLYDMRPLSELINPITFPDLKTNGAIAKMFRARQAIEQAIAARQNAAGALSNAALRQDTSPQVWRINFRDMVCAYNGDEAGGVGTINLLGQVNAELTDMRGKTTVELFGTKFTTDQAEDAYKFDAVQCGPNAPAFPINKKVTVIVMPTDSEQGSIFINMEKLFKYVPLPDRGAENAGITTLKVVSGGWWISAKIVDAIFGKDSIVDGGLADGMQTGIDGLKRDLLTNSVQLDNMSNSRKFTNSNQVIGLYNLQGWPIGLFTNQPKLVIRYETQRVE